MGNGAVSSAGSAANGGTTSPSARERIIQPVDAPVVTGICYTQDGGRGDE